jgi:hypothetical protein
MNNRGSHQRSLVLMSAAFCLLGCVLCAQESYGNLPPVIKHQPITVAAKGQGIAVRATVTDDTAVKAVTLYYSTSKDVAPFKLQMQPAGAGVYVATIPANLLGKASLVTYYIEAADDQGATAETRWYDVSIQAPQAVPAAAKGGAEPARKEKEEGSFWTKPATIVGGVLLLGGATAAIIASSSKSDHGSSSSTDPNAGTYVGSVTTSLEFAGQTPAYSSHGMTIAIGSDGAVSSDTLYEGQHLQGTLQGSDFTLTAVVSETNLSYDIQYVGSIMNSRITGSVGGTARTGAGTNGVYYGSFYAVKQ